MRVAPAVASSPRVAIGTLPMVSRQPYCKNPAEASQAGTRGAVGRPLAETRPRLPQCRLRLPLSPAPTPCGDVASRAAVPFSLHSTGFLMTKGVTVWFTGLSGSGKTTVARRLHDLLRERHVHAERLDGDVVRQSLTRDLGFSREDRDK